MVTISLFDYPIVGGIAMNAQEYWKIFLETGAPEMYLLFRQQCRQEDKHVLEDSGIGAACHRLQ